MDCVVCRGEGVGDSPSSASRSDTNLVSVCLARGRSYTVPPTKLVENCDRWHLSNIADPRDGPMNSMAVLRRDLVGAIPSPVPNRTTNTDIIPLNSILTVVGWALSES